MGLKLYLKLNLNCIREADSVENQILCEDIPHKKTG